MRSKSMKLFPGDGGGEEREIERARERKAMLGRLNEWNLNGPNGTHSIILKQKKK
jgi:hypothetical protein